MKRKSVLFSISLIVIFSMVVGLTTTTAQSAPSQSTQPITLNADMTSAEVVAALPRDGNLVLQWSTVGSGCLLESILFQLQ